MILAGDSKIRGKPLSDAMGMATFRDYCSLSFSKSSTQLERICENTSR